MLVFLDESGDSGLQGESGSSRFFTVALVVFEEHDEATACDQRISLLRREIGWREGDEFHFTRNSHRVRLAFLNAAVPYSFFYYAIVLNKSRLWGEGLRHKDSFYKYACRLVFENAKERLQDAIVVIDRSGRADFRRQLARYLRDRANTGEAVRMKKLKMERSSSNNLLQLADYVAGVVNRSVQRKKNADEYRRLIAHREISVQVWPGE